jgi:hypothetical protein
MTKAMFVGTLIFLACAGAFGEKSEPFDRINLVLDYAWNTNRNGYHEYWDANNGFGAAARTPFYLGSIEVGCQIASNHANRAVCPEYLSLFGFFGWGAGHRISGDISWYNGLRLGNYYMQFDDEMAVRTVRNESELAYEFISEIGFSPVENYTVSLSGRYRKIFTHRRIHLSYISLGIARSFGTPGWLRDFLK